ncbi:hypothetical protein SAMD00024442_21_9 [Candidatus Symbiothrix dinenymphae]|nr:hypothetical protein SAMD00024442_21_9 [Candidatus Symbiothrix dinenymphae]
MKKLLEQDFTYHYNKNKENPVTVVVLQQTTREIYFELIDDDIIVYHTDGIAKYENQIEQNVYLINYENFINSLPPRVKNNFKEVCDLIVYTDKCFLLNELTDTHCDYIPKKRIKAQSQLLQTLHDLMAVEHIQRFINSHFIRHCCFFNKQTFAPSSPLIINGRKEKLSVTNVFNKQNTYSNGLQIPNSYIEALGFEYWEFSGSQTYLLK